jgi:hypothetical protein
MPMALNNVVYVLASQVTVLTTASSKKIALQFPNRKIARAVSGAQQVSAALCRDIFCRAGDHLLIRAPSTFPSHMHVLPQPTQHSFTCDLHGSRW